MSKEELEKISDHIENNSSEVEATKNLCVHELRKRLKDKQKKENISKLVILSILVFFIGFLLLFII